jgi:EmrB/QacA subfamily drug resistance transporter
MTEERVRTAGDPYRWRALAGASIAQLVIALDATIMNVALPSVQRGLGFTDADRQWVITGYTLAFGGLLLLGGRIADQVGRRRAFLIGLAGFGAASALGGLAGDLPQLAVARAAQGAFGALLAPTVLALISVTFTEPVERGKAFALFGAIAGSGGALGLVLGGLLAEHLSWRACLLVNVPIVAVAALTARYLPDDGGSSRGGRLDVPGAVLVTTGVVGVVAGCSRAAALGWSSAPVVGLLGGGVVLLGVFLLREARAEHPLLPPRILADRNRGGAYLAVAFAVAGLLGVFLLLTYYFQVVRGYSPALAGLAFLPLSASVFGSAQLIAARLLPRLAPRVLIAPGLLVASAALAVLTRLTPSSGYLSFVLPAELVLGVGIGCVFTPAVSTATSQVGRRDAGVAAAVVNTAQQVGGSVGVALLNTVAATAALATAVGVASAWLAAAAALVAVLITAAPPRPIAAPPRPTAAPPPPTAGAPRAAEGPPRVARPEGTS